MILPSGAGIWRGMPPLTRGLLVVAALAAVVAVLGLLFGPKAAAGPVGLALAGAAEGERRRRRAARVVRDERAEVVARDERARERAEALSAASDAAVGEAATASLDELARRSNER